MENAPITSKYIGVAHRDAEIFELRRQGWYAREIAGKYGIALRSVYRALARCRNAAA